MSVNATVGSPTEVKADPLLIRLGTEVRETLHNFMGLLELVTSEPLTENQAQYLSHSRASADQLLSFANDLLELAEIEPAPLLREVFSVETVVTEIATLMSMLAETRGFKLTWDLNATPASAPPAWVTGDRRLLQDTLHRLIASAMHLAPGGEMHLSVSANPATQAAAEQAPASASLDKRDLTFEVTAPAGNTAEKLFSSSEPAANSAESAMGLSVVCKRAQHLGGNLSTTVSDGRATLRLTVPFSAAPHTPPAETPAASSDGSPRLAPLNLLVAEDSDDSFFLLQAYLSNEQHRIARATDGAQAVEMVKAGHYDFVVMDVKMPVMDGYTASRLIREWETQQGRPRLPILLLSADEPGRQMRIGASVGCSGYLTKPATKAQVLAALDFYSRPPERKGPQHKGPEHKGNNLSESNAADAVRLTGVPPETAK